MHHAASLPIHGGAFLGTSSDMLAKLSKSSQRDFGPDSMISGVLNSVLPPPAAAVPAAVPASASVAAPAIPPPHPAVLAAAQAAAAAASADLTTHVAPAAVDEPPVKRQKETSEESADA